MDKHLQDALELARQALAKADPDELLKDFLEFEETATGPTVNEMFAALNTPTEEILNVKPLHRR